jgi:hypothetical protein
MGSFDDGGYDGRRHENSGRDAGHHRERQENYYGGQTSGGGDAEDWYRGFKQYAERDESGRWPLRNAEYRGGSNYNGPRETGDRDRGFKQSASASRYENNGGYENGYDNRSYDRRNDGRAGEPKDWYKGFQEYADEPGYNRAESGESQNYRHYSLNRQDPDQWYRGFRQYAHDSQQNYWNEPNFRRHEPAPYYGDDRHGHHPRNRFDRAERNYNREGKGRRFHGAW